MSENKVAQAFALYRQQLAALIDHSPLAGIAEWVATGSPPPADHLRRQGFTAETPTPQDRLQSAFARNWGFAIPCAEAVAALRGLGAPIVEIGAGSGYWTALLGAAGLDVIGTDLAADAESAFGQRLGQHAALVALGARAAVEAWPDRDVFCAWPSRGEAWSAEAVAAIRPGRAFALIGEPRGGLTGADALFDLLDTAFALEAEVAIPQFPGKRDRLTIHRRR